MPVHGVAVHPDGLRIFVAAGPMGVAVLDSAVPPSVRVVPLAAGGGVQPNPQGIAVSPDGRRLYVSANTNGGAISVVDLATQTVVGSIRAAAGSMPLGIAFT